MLGDVLAASGIMAGVALFFGVVLAVAHRKLKVQEDPRIDVLEDKLPGSNCGACGMPGCRAFAEALVQDEVAPAGCTVNSPEGIDDIAGFLGVDAGSADKRVARLACAGGASSVKNLATYDGLSSCRAAHVVNAGGRACAWGCLGLGDCEVVCDFDAIAMSADALPVVTVDKCTACGDCVDVCPLDLFSLQSLEQPLIVQCSSPLRGDAATAVCHVACDACGRCASDAPAGVIEMVDGLPLVRQPAIAPEAATFRCPTGAIAWVPAEQFRPAATTLERRVAAQGASHAQLA